ncbi:MAG: hypothetical protein Q8942_13120 [Bacillota bacterium]|nr:hypothetical protein [Bacillota bacterium]
MNEKIRNILKKFRIIITLLLTIAISISINIGVDKWREYKYKPLFEKYLSERYTEEMVVSSIYKGSKWGEYECYTYPKRNPNMYFYTFLKKDKTTNGYVFSDHYFQTLWQGEVQSEVEEYIKTFFDNIHSVNFMIMGKPQYDKDPIQYVFDFKNYIPKSKVPTYDEIKGNSDIKEYYKTLDINIIGELKARDIEKENNNVLKVVMFIKEKGYNIDHLTVSYGHGAKSGNNSSFSTDSDNMYLFDKREIDNIKSVDDIKKLK